MTNNLFSILKLSRESNSLLKVLVCLRKRDSRLSQDPREESECEATDISDDEASGDEATWATWVNVITFQRDKVEKERCIPAIFSSKGLKHELRYQG